MLAPGVGACCRVRKLMMTRVDFGQRKTTAPGGEVQTPWNAGVAKMENPTDPVVDQCTPTRFSVMPPPPTPAEPPGLALLSLFDGTGTVRLTLQEMLAFLGQAGAVKTTALVEMNNKLAAAVSRERGIFRRQGGGRCTRRLPAVSGTDSGMEHTRSASLP